MAGRIPGRSVVAKEEDAGELRLGKEFDPKVATALMICEAHALLQEKLQKGDVSDDMDSVFRRSLAYTENFDRVRELENTQAIRERLDRQRELHPYERAQLVNLLPDTAEEAKSIIPSLQDKVNEDQLNHLLQDLASFTQQ
uniref:RNA polymerase Rpb4/RPC9 core domain-containing protein n=1 Tax=Rhodosorus marinus TaxID=101924 RepID=A0A7S3EJM0_9RHOD|mmetsp:Transcript_41340/g.162916  ORF Transcript_41340/g.162916 Transcript_41340/m.162916 type:complete len:141 (+) Transcript_41340:101-523(+)